MEKSDSYYFAINWEVCARSGEKILLFRDRLRSAVRIIDKYYYLAGPDLRSRPEFTEPDESRRELLYDIFPSGENRAGLDQGWKLPGEPRAVFANFGRKMNSRFHLYELWEDSGLVIKESGWTCLEPVMYNHACQAILDLIAGFDNKPDLFFGTGRLCVKRKMPDPETVLNSIASFNGKLNYSGHVNIYFESNTPDEKSAVIPAGVLSTELPLDAASPGVSPLAFGPVAAGRGKTAGAFLSAEKGDKSAPATDDAAVTRFFTRIRRDDRNHLSSFLWIMGQ